MIKKRVIITSILTTMNPIDAGIGFIIPALIVPDDNTISIEKGKQ